MDMEKSKRKRNSGKTRLSRKEGKKKWGGEWKDNKEKNKKTRSRGRR
jgi:hypothetical protein